MQNNNHKASKYRKKRYRTLLLTLSTIVVFVTTYMLILPAVTIDKNTAEQMAGIDLGSLATGVVSDRIEASGSETAESDRVDSSGDISSGITLDKTGVKAVNSSILSDSADSSKSDSTSGRTADTSGIASESEQTAGIKQSDSASNSSKTSQTAETGKSYTTAESSEADKGDSASQVNENGIDQNDTTAQGDTTGQDDITNQGDTAGQGDTTGQDDISNQGNITNQGNTTGQGDTTNKTNKTNTADRVDASFTNKDDNEAEMSRNDTMSTEEEDESDDLESEAPVLNFGDLVTYNATSYQNVTGTDAFDGMTEMVLWTEVNGHYYALKADGTTAEFQMSDIDHLGRDYLWTVTYGWNHTDGVRYFIRPVSDTTKNISLSWDNNDIVSSGDCGNLITETTSGGYIVEGWNTARLQFDTSTKSFYQYRADQGSQYQGAVIHFSTQGIVSSFGYTVKSADSTMGLVSVGNGTSSETVYGQTDSNKKNAEVITAAANGPTDSKGNSKYIFDYWDLNGTRLSNQTSAMINAGALDFTYEGYVLTAHFKRNPAYVEENEEYKVGRTFTDEEKDELSNWLSELQNRAVPLDVSGTTKTAEVYDYENRIYRVDLSAKSNLETFDGVIDLGFILDMSGSMQFPATLTEVAVVDSNSSTSDWYVRKNVRTSSNKWLNDNTNNWTQNYWGGIEVSNSEGQVLIGRLNDDETTKNILNKNKTYYYVADRSGTFTVYHMKFNTSTNRWVSSDASRGSYYDMGWNTYYKSNDERGLYYTLYEASDNGSYTTQDATDLTKKDTNRKWYLENSLNNTINECNKILEKISIAKGDANNKNPDVEIAYNTFYAQVDVKSYNFKSTKSITETLSYDTNGGTGTDLALLSATGEKYSNETMNGNVDRSSYTKQTYTSSGDDPAGFQWNTNDNRYVILITDGAPQSNSKAIANQYVVDAANKLKNEDNVTLITVGLSMSDVKRGSVLLYDIASKDSSGEPMFFAAEGDDLQYVLYSIIRTIMQEAIVEGNVTDTVNEAFYPVDKTTGAPLKSGNVINLDGEKIADSESKLTPAQKSAGYGVIGTDASGNYTVTWSGAEFTWDGWRGTIYEKAKEDYLGGNAVRTNDPSNPAKVEATGYKFNSGDKAIALDTSGTKVPEANRIKTLDTPRVNVNELSFTNNDTDWTVYLGTEVDARDQLEELLRNILVEETVTDASDTDNDGLQDKMTGTSMYYPLTESTSDQRESEGTGSRLAYPLWKLLRNLETNIDNRNKSENEYINWMIDELISGGSSGASSGGVYRGELSYDYDLYGTSDSKGVIKISLTKSGETADYDDHTTTVTGSPVETYKLNVSFTPNYTHIPQGQGGSDPYEYNTGSNGTGSCGIAAGDENSYNTHVVNVFAKKLEINKVDQAQSIITSNPATFVLYRKATDTELADNSVVKTSILGLTGQYVAVQTLVTDGGSVTSDILALNSDNEPYYLVETKSPAGYYLLTEPLMVTIDMTDHNTWTKVPVTDPAVTSQTKWSPYVLSNWLQEATIIVSAVSDASGNSTGSNNVGATSGSGSGGNGSNSNSGASGNSRASSIGNASEWAVRVFSEGEREVTYDHNNDATDASVTYKIINNSGVVLPSTGGIGTELIYGFGIVLAALACMGLMVRKIKMSRRA